MSEPILREMRESDLPALFEIQCDADAQQAVLDQVPERPVFAGAAHDNLGSMRVLEKRGFQRIGKDRGFAEARGEEIEEVLFRLD